MSFLSLSLSSIISPDSVRLVEGTSLCSGRLEVKSDQSTQTWSSVCEQDFDQQDAEVVCRELGCGAPSVLQGALYGELEAPTWTKEFQCGGHESALLDCRSSDRNTCSSGTAVGLTCSEPVRLVGGASRCSGTLELNHQREWRPVINSSWEPKLYNENIFQKQEDVGRLWSFYLDWTLKAAAVVCRKLGCGSAVSVGKRTEFSARPVWGISSDCVQSVSALRGCATSESSIYSLNLTCSDSVRLVEGTSLCSGRLEVKSDQSTQRWSSVCEQDFDQQDAEVVCRELGCGAPSVLQGALYGELEAPMWTKVFQCGGHESALLDCRSSDRNTCSSGTAVGLTCSEPVRLVGGASRCSGTLELKHQGEWRPVDHYNWPKTLAAAACKELDCGSALSEGQVNTSSDHRHVWWFTPDLQSGCALRECAASSITTSTINLTCSDLLLQPTISVSSSMDGVSEAQEQGFKVFRGSNFNISCSVQPQYPGGSFQLSFTSSDSAHSSTQTAVNHSAHFLFPAAEPAHQGNYSCVYHQFVFSHNFSSESRLLSLTLIDPRPFRVRGIVLPLILLLATAGLYFFCKVRTRLMFPPLTVLIELKRDVMQEMDDFVKEKLLEWTLAELLPAFEAALGQRVNYPDPVCGVRGSTVTLPCSFIPLKSVNANGREVLIEVVRVVWCKNHETCQETPSLYDSQSQTNDPRYRYLGDKKGDCTLQISDLQKEEGATYRFRMEMSDPKASFTAPTGLKVKVVGKSILW
ncbi:scavenger receptor cysteine-rich type 1 protein M130 [Etheostoma spectabile]|uniref:scavenger receptor cysteine-rich type 1 protein M130 n=1 Tax=Etheostoma spectabile TaxID=54343 RepID=UPI0013AF36AD|nr:scavenger receptor cysteine-rich type 1 protein M130-like [Etheostoma spectabile]